MCWRCHYASSRGTLRTNHSLRIPLPCPASRRPPLILPAARAQIIGLAIITAAFSFTAHQSITKRFVCIVGIPVAVTMLVYAVTDRSKFHGFSSEDEFEPLSNWRGGSFGVVDFSQLWKAPVRHGFYIVRVFSSVTINICSILLVLIDAVCLEVRHQSGRGQEDRPTYPGVRQYIAQTTPVSVARSQLLQCRNPNNTLAFSTFVRTLCSLTETI